MIKVQCNLFLTDFRHQQRAACSLELPFTADPSQMKITVLQHFDLLSVEKHFTLSQFEGQGTHKGKYMIQVTLDAPTPAAEASVTALAALMEQVKSNNNAPSSHLSLSNAIASK